MSVIRCQGWKTGWQGKWRMVRVWGVCTHNRLNRGKRGRAPTSQVSLWQRQTWIPEGVFQWWCYPRRASTGRRREWISAELAALYSHTAASLWVSNISWDHFLTTVKLTAFDHRGACIWYFFFLCYIVCRILILWPGVEAVPPALEAQRHNHWTSRNWTPRKVLVPSFEKLCSFFKPSLRTPFSRRSFLINPGHSLQTQTTSNQHHTGDSFIWHVFTFYLSLRLAWTFLRAK